MGPQTDQERRRPLPASGSSSDRVYVQPDQDYPGDTDICFARGNSVTVVRLTPADLAGLLAAVGGLAPKLAGLVEEGRNLAFQDPPVERAGLANDIAALARRARAAGRALCDEDCRVTGEDGQRARVYLIGLKEDGTGRGHLDAEALERVIALLEP